MKIYSIGKTENEYEVEVLYIEFRLEIKEDWSYLQYMITAMVHKEYCQELHMSKPEFEYLRHRRSVITYNHETGILSYRIKSTTKPLQHEAKDSDNILPGA